MAFSGGTYTLPAGNPVTTNTTIQSSWWNTTGADLATALSTCVLKDGTQTLTANIPMGGFKLTGLAAGSAANDSVRLAQLQGGSASYLTGTAGTNTITAAGTPVVASLTTGQRFTFIPANTNTAAATLQVDSTSALSIFWNNVALIGGELQQNVPVTVLYDGTQYQLIASGAHANTFAIPDTMRLQAAGDRTKQLAISLTGITTLTTRTLTMPDSNVNLNGLTGTQSANMIYAGPVSGAAALPAFRALDGLDGSSLVLISTQTAASVATVDFTSGITSTYDRYILNFTKVIPGTDNTDLWVRASISGGSSYLSTNEYSHARFNVDTVPVGTPDGAGATAQFVVKGSLGNSTGEQMEGSLSFQNLADTVVYKGAYGMGCGVDQAAAYFTIFFGCNIFTTSAVNALRVMMSSGNINGIFSLYGVRKV